MNEFSQTYDPLIGQICLHYQILDQIGQGGMSTVYRAKDLRLGREVAVKVLHPYLASKKSCRSRFFAEAQTVARLQHPNILQIFDYSGEIEKDLFIVTELVKGLTLFDFAKSHNIHSVPEFGAMIIWEILLALDHAHNQGVIHRDIKPENIMVRDDGILKLMDFGIARLAEAESLTVTGTLLGSPAYMPPELIQGKQPDKRCDIFAISAVLYWLTTGKLPFSGKSPHAILRSIVDGDFEPPQQASPLISNHLGEIILRGMAQEPNHRFQTAKEMSDALEETFSEISLSISPNRLTNLLVGPEQHVEELKAEIISSCLTKAEQSIESNEVAEALIILNRVLAQEPENEKAQALIAQGTKIKVAKRNWLIISLSFLIFGIVALNYSKKDVSDQAIAAIPPKKFEPIDQPKATIPLLPPAPQKEAELVAAPIASSKQKILVTVSPFADISIDGILVKRDAKFGSFQLDLGIHTITFSHKYAETEERIIDIKRDAQPKELTVDLKRTKPAYFFVYSNIEADIVVNHIYKGTLKKSAGPMLISLPDKTHAAQYEIIVSKVGFTPFIQSHLFTAGETTSINVHLEKIG